MGPGTPGCRCPLHPCLVDGQRESEIPVGLSTIEMRCRRERWIDVLLLVGFFQFLGTLVQLLVSELGIGRSPSQTQKGAEGRLHETTTSPQAICGFACWLSPVTCRVTAESALLRDAASRALSCCALSLLGARSSFPATRPVAVEARLDGSGGGGRGRGWWQGCRAAREAIEGCLAWMRCRLRHASDVEWRLQFRI